MTTAIADGDQIIGCIAATEVRQNLNCTPIVVPNAPSLSSLFNSVLHKAGLKPEDISVIEAHGTGTQVGDPAEWESIRNVLGGPRSRQGQQNLVVGSVKGHIGHTECTSGVAALIKILLMMHAGKIPPQASFTKLNPALHATAMDRMEISTTLKDWNSDFRAALINNVSVRFAVGRFLLTHFTVWCLRLKCFHHCYAAFQAAAKHNRCNLGDQWSSPFHIVRQRFAKHRP